MTEWVKHQWVVVSERHGEFRQVEVEAWDVNSAITAWIWTKPGGHEEQDIVRIERKGL